MPTDPWMMIGFLLCMFAWIGVAVALPMVGLTFFVADRTMRLPPAVSLSLTVTVAAVFFVVALVLWGMPVATLIFDWWGVPTT